MAGGKAGGFPQRIDGLEMNTKRTLFSLAAAVLSVALGTAARGDCAADELTVRDVVKKAAPSVVRIEVFDKAGDRVAQGTGFFIAPHLVLTNAHVVDEFYSLQVVLNSPRTGFELLPKILKCDEDADLALLRVEHIDAPPLPIDPGVKIEVGQAVVVYGNDFEGVPLASEGIVRACLDGEIVHSAPSHGGHSGSPILDMEGRVLGVNSGSYNRSGISNMGFAITPSVIVEFLKKPDAPRSLPWAGKSRFWARQWKRVSGFFSRVFRGVFDLGTSLFSFYLKGASILILAFLGWKAAEFLKKSRKRLKAKLAEPAVRANPVMAYMALTVWLISLIVSVFTLFLILVWVTETGAVGELAGYVVTLAISYPLYFYVRRYYRQNRPGKRAARPEPATSPGVRNGVGAAAE